MKIVNIGGENLYIFEWFEEFNEIFRKYATYDNIKSQQKPGLYPLSRRYSFWKPQKLGRGGSNWSSLPQSLLRVNEDCLKIFLLLFAFPVMIPVCRKDNHLAQKSYFYQKATNKQSWKLPKLKFWPKPNIQNSVYTKPLNLTRLTCFIYLLKIGLMHRSYSKCQKT